jgi:hypothetical protein
MTREGLIAFLIWLPCAGFLGFLIYTEWIGLFLMIVCLLGMVNVLHLVVLWAMGYPCPKDE